MPTNELPILVEGEHVEAAMVGPNDSRVLHLTGGFRAGRFDGYVILAYWPEKGEWVVARWDGRSPEWEGGDYYGNATLAMSAYVRRAELSTIVDAYLFA